MEAKKKRLTLDLDPALQRRLKAVAALKGISMRQYCQTAIDKELVRDEASPAYRSCLLAAKRSTGSWHCKRKHLTVSCCPGTRLSLSGKPGSPGQHHERSGRG